MSRRRRSRRGSSAQASRASGMAVRRRSGRPTTQRRFGGKAWRVGAVGLVFTAGVIAFGLWQGRKPAPPPVPKIELTGLSSNLTELVQERMEAVEQHSQSGQAWGRLGSLLKSLEFRQEAAVCLEVAMEFEPEEPRWPYHLAVLMLGSGQNTEKAIRYLRRSASLCGNDPPLPRLRLARVLVEMGRTEEARKELERLLEANPELAPAKMLQAHLRQMEGDWAKAISLARQCATNPHTSRAAWSLLAQMYLRQGNPNEAERASRRAAAVTADVPWPDPFEEELFSWRQDARSLSDRARSKLVAGRVQEAWPLVETLSRNYPDRSETWLLLGRAQYLRREPVQAEASLRRFLTMEPKSVNGHFQLGMSLMAQQRFLEAAELFRGATALKADFGPAHFNLGFCLARAGRREEAIPAFEQAIRHNPEFIDSYVLLADLVLDGGDTMRARALAGLAADIDLEDPRLRTLWEKIREAE